MESLKPLIPLILAWVAYFFIHSALASLSVKESFYRRGISPRTYRLIYSLLSSILLLVLLFYNGLLGGEFLVPRTRILRYSGLFVAAGGIFVLRAAFRQYSLREFLGLGKMKEENKLRQAGILRQIRHPIYTATILITLGYALFDPRLPALVSVACIWIYLPVGIRLEENKLIKEYGDAYRKYRKAVPALFPKLRLFS